MKTQRSRVLGKLKRIEGDADVVAYDAIHNPRQVRRNFAELLGATTRLEAVLRRYRRQR